MRRKILLQIINNITKQRHYLNNKMYTINIFKRKWFFKYIFEILRDCGILQILNNFILSSITFIMSWFISVQ